MQDKATFYAEALVISTRFFEEHIGIKWWADCYYYHKGLFHTSGTLTQSLSLFTVINLE